MEAAPRGSLRAAAGRGKNAEEQPPTNLLHVERSERRVRRRRQGTAALAFGVLDAASFGRGGRRRLERWRRRHGGPGRPIPEALWDEAAVLARVEGVAATARALRLDLARLEQRMTLPGSAPEALSRASDGFVEIDARGLCAPGQTIVRVEGRDGERLEIQWNRASAQEVAALIRAFGSRPR